MIEVSQNRVVIIRPAESQTNTMMAGSCANAYRPLNKSRVDNTSLSSVLHAHSHYHIKFKTHTFCYIQLPLRSHSPLFGFIHYRVPMCVHISRVCNDFASTSSNTFSCCQRPNPTQYALSHSYCFYVEPYGTTSPFIGHDRIAMCMHLMIDTVVLSFPGA